MTEQARRREQLDDRLIPLINIIFLMLIFFMVAGHISSQTLPEDLTLPGSSIRTPAEKAPLVLSLDRQERLTLNGIAITGEELRTQLSPLSESDPNTRLQLCVDQALTAAALTPLMQQLRKIGLHRITLISTTSVSP